MPRWHCHPRQWCHLKLIPLKLKWILKLNEFEYRHTNRFYLVREKDSNSAVLREYWLPLWRNYRFKKWNESSNFTFILSVDSKSSFKSCVRQWWTDAACRPLAMIPLKLRWIGTIIFLYHFIQAVIATYYEETVALKNEMNQVTWLYFYIIALKFDNSRISTVHILKIKNKLLIL